MLRSLKLAALLGLTLAFNATLAAEETHGTIKSVDTARNEVVLKGIVNNSVYELSKDASVWLDGSRSKLTDLNTDDRAVIHYEKTGEHMRASQVRALRRAKETTGTVHEVVGDRREVVLKGTIKNSTYELAKGATVWVEGKVGAMTDIHAGDEVLVTYETRGEHYFANDITVRKRK